MILELFNFTETIFQILLILVILPCVNCFAVINCILLLFLILEGEEAGEASGAGQLDPDRQAAGVLRAPALPPAGRPTAQAQPHRHPGPAQGGGEGLQSPNFLTYFTLESGKSSSSYKT